MISPIESNGMVARTQDYASMRQQDDSKLFGAQLSIQQRMDERDQANVRTVRDANGSGKSDTHHDARDEGRNKYFDIRDKKKAKKEPPTEGTFTLKSNHGGFDLKI